MPSTFFQCKITNIIMTTNIRPNLKRRYGTQSSSRSNHKSNVQDLIPVPKRHNPGFNNVSYIRTPQLLVKGTYFWRITCTCTSCETAGTFCYLSMDNNGELRTVIGRPNPDFGPNIFGLEPGGQAGQYIIYTYAMVPNDNNGRYALTVVKNANGDYCLEYSNDHGYNYDWCFIPCYHNDNYAIRWCGKSDKNTSFVLSLDSDVLKLTIYPANETLPSKHFISSFNHL